LFDEIGVRRAIDRAPFIRATGNTVQWAGGEQRVEMFPGGALGYQVPRDGFDKLLLIGAQMAGASIDENAPVWYIEREGEWWHVHIDAPEGQRSVFARWVLDCSGRAGVVARRFRFEGSESRTLAIAGAWERADRWPLPDESHTVVESYANGWAWSVPASPSLRFVTLMLDPRVSAIPKRAELERIYAAELARTRAMRELTDGATLLRPPWACDATPYHCMRVTDDGLLLVGDAASFVDPLSSFGVKKALASAWLAAVVTHTALTEPSMSGAAIDLFADRERAMYEYLRRASAALSAQAAGTHDTAFWASRGDDPIEESSETGDWEIDVLRRNPRVLAAFDELKRVPSIRLQPTRSLLVAGWPIVRGHRVVLEDHLLSPSVTFGIRYLRNVDLVSLVRLAPQFDQVPDLYEAYNRASPPVPLPDFLGALSALLGIGMLAFT
jgi:flavin-dependent dehydrogenase